jgi:diacylglycerol kinase
MLTILNFAAVLSSELINTALERICDRITKDRDPLIGNAKDGSGFGFDNFGCSFDYWCNNFYALFCSLHAGY